MAFLIGLVRPRLEAIIVKPWDHVHMGMHHDLAGSREVIHAHIHPIARKIILDGLRDPLGHSDDRLHRVYRSVYYVLMMLLRDDESMARMDWIDVKESDDLIILADYL